MRIGECPCKRKDARSIVNTKWKLEEKELFLLENGNGNGELTLPPNQMSRTLTHRLIKHQSECYSVGRFAETKLLIRYKNRINTETICSTGFVSFSSSGGKWRKCQNNFLPFVWFGLCVNIKIIMIKTLYARIELKMTSHSMLSRIINDKQRRFGDNVNTLSNPSPEDKRKRCADK